MGALYLGQESANLSAPASPLVGIFPKNDGFIYYIDSGGTLRQLALTGSSGVPTTLSGVAGTNTITATITAHVTAYASGLVVLFIPAATNTGATTINLTPSGSSALGAKNIFWNGAACSGGELVLGVPVLLDYDGTQFNILGPTISSRLTNSLGSDVNLTNTANYFDGPSVAQGTVGTWFASGQITITDTNAGGANCSLKLWDGTTVISSGYAIPFITTGASVVTTHLSGYISSPAGNIRISAKNATNTTNTAIKFNVSGNSKDSTLSVWRLQ